MALGEALGGQQKAALRLRHEHLWLSQCAKLAKGIGASVVQRATAHCLWSDAGFFALRPHKVYDAPLVIASSPRSSKSTASKLGKVSRSSQATRFGPALPPPRRLLGLPEGQFRSKRAMPVSTSFDGTSERRRCFGITRFLSWICRGGGDPWALRCVHLPIKHVRL